MFKRIVLVAGDHASTAAVYNSLPGVTAVILEKPESRMLFLRRRAKRLGWLQVLGQVAFQALIVPLLRRTSLVRVQQIQKEDQLDLTPIPEGLVHRVRSVNDQNTGELLSSLSPDLVVVHGTRIISAATLGCASCSWVNIHAGITPKYRGSHGAYWALLNQDEGNCGVTLHLVDAGIDTGDYLAQARIKPGPEDNFVTYPWMQLAEGLRLLRQAIQDWPSPHKGEGESRLHYHPTIWGYAWGRLRGIR